MARGYYCFLYKGLYYTIYNQIVSYPEELGEKLVNQLRNLEPQDLRNMLDNMIIVVKDHYSILSSDIIEKFSRIPSILKKLIKDFQHFEEQL